MNSCYKNNYCGCGYDYNKMDSDFRSYKVAMAYVPWQQFENLYDPATALQEGTVFCDLNQIFCGRRGNRPCAK